ncbi:DUF805 domain-containing protein [Maricaulis sp.]|uniref:DUF805 domain-containing protein n=1 Tax=Maricaulis sp. TaxID=1486257 RepID=UPI002B272972|nr:DUF805 domain-containing protein [Maricaulis sp.]
MDWQFLLFDPNGRIGQKDFWIGVAIILGGNILADVVPILGGLLWLLLVWVGIAVYGKRLHDIGRSAGLHAIPWALNLVLFLLGFMMLGGVIVTAIMTGGDVGPGLFLSAGGGLLSLGAISVLVWAVYTIWLGLAIGDSGDNVYGMVPPVDGAATRAGGATDPKPNQDPKLPPAGGGGDGGGGGPV